MLMGANPAALISMRSSPAPTPSTSMIPSFHGTVSIEPTQL